MSYYNCFDCKKVSPLLGDLIDQCPLCGRTNGEVISHEHFKAIIESNEDCEPSSGHTKK